MKMIIRAVFLCACLAAAVARLSPRADLVEELQRSPDGSRYSNDVYEDAKLDVEGLITKYGYPFEAHTVVTEDGYVLELQRMPHGRDNNNQPGQEKTPVLLMHGLLSSCADYVVLGPGNALGYMLAEEGYDVWLGNARGNYYSRQHNRFNPDNRVHDFWRFSWDEIGNYDLPAFIDYILETTGQPKLHYFGHSQGSTSFLVMASLRPEYNDKIISFQGLAPAAFFNNNANIFYNAFAPLEGLLMMISNTLSIGEVLGKSDILSYVSFNYCRDGSTLQPFCMMLFVNGENRDYFNSTMLPMFLGHSPAGSSLAQVSHYAQGINDHLFRRYDHGTLQNLRLYGTASPPMYDLSKITAPAYLHYGLADREADYRDVRMLGESLPNTKGVFGAPRPSFTHFDFIWGMDAREQLYNRLIELLKEAENEDADI